jgi:hypothetical protein
MDLRLGVALIPVQMVEVILVFDRLVVDLYELYSHALSPAFTALVSPKFQSGASILDDFCIAVGRDAPAACGRSSMSSTSKATCCCARLRQMPGGATSTA